MFSEDRDKGIRQMTSLNKTREARASPVSNSTK